MKVKFLATAGPAALSRHNFAERPGRNAAGRLKGTDVADGVARTDIRCRERDCYCLARIDNAVGRQAAFTHDLGRPRRSTGVGTPLQVGNLKLPMRGPAS